MPKTSLAGSIFPGLEQEQQSLVHPKRASADNSKREENSQKTGKAEENKS